MKAKEKIRKGYRIHRKGNRDKRERVKNRETNGQTYTRTDIPKLKSSYATNREVF